MAAQDEAQRPVRCIVDADAGRDADFGRREAVFPQLEGRGRTGEVEGIVERPGESQRLAKAARAGGELTGRSAGSQPAIQGHRISANQRLQRTQQYTTRAARGLAGDVHAEVSAVDGVDIGVPGATKENGVPGRGAAVRVGGGVGWLVVRAKVGLGFNDAAGKDLRTVLVFDPMEEDFAQQARGHVLRRRLKEGAVE